MTSEPVQRQETSHLDDPVSPIEGTHSVHGARGDDDAEAVRSNRDSASTSDQVQDAKEKQVPLTKWQKFKAHWKKWWWVYLIILIVLLAILLPILFTVIVPKIVQNIVNAQKLPIKGGQLTAVSPDDIEISLNTSLNTPLAATIKPAELDLYYPSKELGKPFLSITLPEVHVLHDTLVEVKPQTVKVKDQEELIRWFHTVFDKAETEVRILGKPTAKLSTLTYHPKIDKTIKVKALNYLKGFGIKDMQFDLGGAAGSKNLKGTLTLPNSGILALELGNLVFNMMSGNITLGYANLNNTVLKPGDNFPPFDGQFYFGNLFSNIGQLLQDQSEPLSRGVIQLNATGNATRLDGKSIEYVNQVLNKKQIPIEVPVVTLLSSVVNGLLDNKSSLQDLVGDIFGNDTLSDTIMKHWEDFNNSTSSTDAKKKLKRGMPSASLVWNMMRLSNRVKKHEL